LQPIERYLNTHHNLQFFTYKNCTCYVKIKNIFPFFLL
jgi:hypothetical protein